MVEHNNNCVKEMIGNQGANVSFSSAQLISRMAKSTKEIIENFDKGAAIKPVSGKHTRADSKDDIKRVVNCLLENKVFSNIHGRSHSAFPKCRETILHSISKPKLFTRIERSKKDCHIRLEFKSIESYK